MTPILIALIAALGTAVGVLVQWLIARRKSSGKVQTTEAETLWAEGKQMRVELREETLALRAEAVMLRKEAAILREEAAALRLEMSAVRVETAVLRTSVATAEAETKRLSLLLDESRLDKTKP